LTLNFTLSVKRGPLFWAFIELEMPGLKINRNIPGIAKKKRFFIFESLFN
jgi:hypothetical protein